MKRTLRLSTSITGLWQDLRDYSAVLRANRFCMATDTSNIEENILSRNSTSFKLANINYLKENKYNYNCGQKRDYDSYVFQ